jgi:hypothetical protein
MNLRRRDIKGRTEADTPSFAQGVLCFGSPVFRNLEPWLGTK